MEHTVNKSAKSKVTRRGFLRGAAAGVIAFQLHQGPPMKVLFKDIKIRELP
jgi:hypothetical protein